jgi:hypothetical protein
MQPIQPLKIIDRRFLYFVIICMVLQCVDVYFFTQEATVLRVVTRIAIVSFMSFWLYRKSSAGLSPRNLLGIISVFTSHVYPYWSNPFNNPEIDNYLIMTLPSVGFILMVLAFLQEKPKKSRNKYFELFRLLLIFIFFPVAFFYFVIYPAIYQSPYIILHAFHFVALLALFYFGMRVNFTEEAKILVNAGIVVIALTNIAISYNSFIEKSEWWTEFIILFALVSRIFIFYGFAVEDGNKIIISK